MRHIRSRQPSAIFGANRSVALVLGVSFGNVAKSPRALALMEDSVQLGQAAHFVAPQTFTMPLMAALYGEMGAVARGITLVRRSIDERDTTIMVTEELATAVLADLHLQQGDLEMAKAVANRLQMEPLPTDLTYIFWGGTLRVRLAYAAGAYEEAITLAAEHETIDRGAFIAGTLYWKAHAYLALSQPQAAYDTLQQARQFADQLGARFRLWSILASLADLEGRLGHAEVAAELRAQARAHIHFIGQHAPADLQASFIALPRVKAISETA